MIGYVVSSSERYSGPVQLLVEREPSQDAGAVALVDQRLAMFIKGIAAGFFCASGWRTPAGSTPAMRRSRRPHRPKSARVPRRESKRTPTDSPEDPEIACSTCVSRNLID